MLPEVRQDVHECVADGPRPSERARMIPIAPHPSPPAERAVHGARETDREATDAARE